MMIVGDSNTEAGEMKEGDNLKATEKQDDEQEVRVSIKGPSKCNVAIFPPEISPS